MRPMLRRALAVVGAPRFPSTHVNMGVVVPQSKQRRISRLSAEQFRFDARALDAAFVEMAGALPKRPEAVARLFHNSASPGRAQCRILIAVIAAKAVIRDAIRLGDRGVIEETAQRVRRFFAQARDEGMRDYYRVASGEISLSEAMEEAARQTADVSASLTHLALAHDANARDEAIREIDAEVLRLANLRAQLVALGEHTRPLNRPLWAVA